MLQFKQGVLLKRGDVCVQPEIISALCEINQIYNKYDVPCVVTSVCDGIHSTNSLHYKGLAVDLRTRDLTMAEQKKVTAEIKFMLGGNFDVVLEKDHIHVEFDPK